MDNVALLDLAYVLNDQGLDKYRFIQCFNEMEIEKVSKKGWHLITETVRFATFAANEQWVI